MAQDAHRRGAGAVRSSGFYEPRLRKNGQGGAKENQGQTPFSELQQT
jgi:hypothetical protein